MTILVTGGAGFIGSNFVLDWIRIEHEPVVALDKLTYAGNLCSLEAVQGDPRYGFVRGDIGDRQLVRDLLKRVRPRAIVHFAAETHVDRSISAPEDFVQTNVVGTFRLLEEVRAYWAALLGEGREAFRFLHVSTDEVYGSLAPGDPPFDETCRYAPNSPYSASKAGSDHLVRAYHQTYGLPVLTTHCSNNYGPFQLPEKLIPRVIIQAVAGQPLQVYGDGLHVRDWLYVGDHCAAIRLLLARGVAGETYNIGAWNERSNLEVVHTLCALLDELSLGAPARPHRALVTHVKDRPGHDRRYAVDAGKMEREIGWRPVESFESGLRKTVQWYVCNRRWVEAVLAGAIAKDHEADHMLREDAVSAALISTRERGETCRTFPGG